MIFSSLEFVCVFLPIVFLVYCMTPGIRLKNAWLIVASLIFYAYGEPVYVLLMIFSAVFNYVFARMIAVFSQKKLLLCLDIMLNLGLLAYFKYAVFFLKTCQEWFGLTGRLPDIRLPVGISFFTFQALSYVIDVYYKKVDVQKSFWNVLLYISFFPQLIAGPIVKYRDISIALEQRKMEVNEVSDGLRRFICGLGKKVLIANTMGQVVDAVFQAEKSNINMFLAWISAIAYMLQIYYDFSGYSDMAIGLGKMFGFQFQENFCYPYGASSIKEFWRRWHISLSTWFKEYLYIPLGGNRKGKIRTGVNKLIVFFCTGLWHGANWTFVLWGLYHGFFSVLEELIPFFKKIPKPIRYLYTILVVCIGFVIFRADNLSQAGFMIQQMFTGTNFDSQSMSFVYQQLTPWFFVMLAVGVIGMAPIRGVVTRIQTIVGAQVHSDSWEKNVINAGLSIGAVILLAWCIVRLSGSTYNPFIYFRF
ncbi:MAG: MBOAT family O-acyltransferase [Lachnospiraceae bacterium]